MKTVFITGSSSGIGFETAKLFAEKGWKVIATMRNPAKGEELAKLENVEIVELNVDNREEVFRVVEEVLKNNDVDVLFNNAGFGMRVPLEKSGYEDSMACFNTNLFGAMYVLQAFIPHFKERKAGVMMTTTSLAGIIALPLDGIYGATKRGLTSMCETLYYEMKPYNVAVKIMIPGATKTNFKTPAKDYGEYQMAADKQKIYLRDGDSSFPTAAMAAQSVYQAAVDGKDKIHYPTDPIAQRLYDQYQKMGVEEFKNYLYDFLFKA